MNRPVRSCGQAKPSPATASPGTRSARPDHCRFHCIADRRSFPMCQLSLRSIFSAAAVLILLALPASSRADGAIDPDTLISRPLGAFNGVAYAEYQAMFEGITSNNHPYRVPCQVIAPAVPGDGSGLFLFDWLNQIRPGTA